MPVFCRNIFSAVTQHTNENKSVRRVTRSHIPSSPAPSGNKGRRSGHSGHGIPPYILKTGKRPRRGLLCLLKKKNSNANDHICWNNGPGAETRPSVDCQTEKEFARMKFFETIKKGEFPVCDVCDCTATVRQ